MKSKEKVKMKPKEKMEPKPKEKAKPSPKIPLHSLEIYLPQAKVLMQLLAKKSQ